MAGVGTGAGTGRDTITGIRTRVGMGAGTGEGTEERTDENEDEGGGEREPGNLRSGYRGGSEDTRRRTTPICNQQPQPQDSTPQRYRRVMLNTRAQG